MAAVDIFWAVVHFTALFYIGYYSLYKYRGVRCATATFVHPSNLESLLQHSYAGLQSGDVRPVGYRSGTDTLVSRP